MSALFKKKSPIERRKKKLQKEISSLDSNIKALSKKAGRKPAKQSAAQTGTPAGETTEAGRGLQPEEKVRRMPGRQRDERLVDYLADNLDSARPLRHERRIQRNKAIVMVIVVLIVLFWLVYRVFYL